MFWNTIIWHHGPNAPALDDECEFSRVKIAKVLSDDKPEDKPFVFPKDVNQVFYVDDHINEGWKLVVKVNPQSSLVVYKQVANSSFDNVQEATSEAQKSDEGFKGSDKSAARCVRRGELVAVKADENAGESENWDKIEGQAIHRTLWGRGKQL